MTPQDNQNLDVNQFINNLAEYGLAGAIVLVGLYVIVLPLVRALIKQQQEGLELLRRSVDANTKAVEAFSRFEVQESEAHTRLTATQDLILVELQRLACRDS